MLCRRRSQLKATLVFTVFLLLALPVFSILDTAGKKCKTDNNCSPPYYLCMDAICTRKPLFPMTGSEIGALVTMILILMFSVTVSIAGGVIIVPISVYLMGFSARQSVALSNCIIVMTAFIKYVMSLFRHNPVVSYKTIVDYNGAIIMVPTMSLFSTIGAVIATFLPDSLVLILLVVTILGSVATGVSNLIKYIKEYRTQNKVGQKAQQVPSESHQIAPEIASIQMKENHLQTMDMNLHKQDQAPADGDWDAPPSTDRESLNSKRFHNRRIEIEQIRQSLPAESAPVGPGEDKSSQNSHAKEIELQKKIEGSNFYYRKFGVIILVLVLSILVAILRPGKGFKALTGILKCSDTDWGIFSLYIILMAGLPIYSAWTVLQEQNLKKEIHWEKDKTEVHFDKKSLIAAVIFCCFVGLVSAILGIGGGILLTPLFLRYKYMPVTSSWTINFNTLLAKVAAVITNIMSGDVIYSYVLFYGGLCTASIVISENVVLEMIKKTKNQTYYPVVFLIVLLVTLTFTIYVGVDNWITKASQGINVWQFNSYC